MACELLEYAIERAGEPVKCDERCKKDGSCTLLDKPFLFPKTEITGIEENKVVFDANEPDNSDFWNEKPLKENIKSVIFGDMIP